MPRSVSTASLRLENLEAREVPAIVLMGTFDSSTNTVSATGGNITINEIGGGTFKAFNSPGGKFDGGGQKTFTRADSSADNITLTDDGSGTLTINDTDGIFVKSSSLDFVGTQFTVKNVTNFTLDLQLGGDDTVTDNTSFASTINGGDGNDNITVSGTNVDPTAVSKFLKPGGLDFASAFTLPNTGQPKTVTGGKGSDTISITGFAIGFKIDGGADDDVINGPFFGALNVLTGGDGNDFVFDGLGADFLVGDTGSDFILDIGGQDFIIAADGQTDLIFNTTGDVVIADPAPTDFTLVP